MKKNLLILFLSTACLASYSQTGTPDPTFGTAGKVTTSIGTVSRIRAMAIQADGKIVAVGLSHTLSNKDFGIVRYNTNGTLDNSFDGDGKVITAIGTGDFDDIALCVAIQADGKILAAGYTNNASDADFAIVRYNTDGSLDNTFDGDGILITSFGAANNAVINAIAIQADGKIVVAGYAYSGADNDFALARYNTNGTLDNSFDTDGKVLTPMGVSNDVINAMVIQADGKIVVAGTAFVAGIDFALARYNTDGSLDISFDGDGKLTTAVGPSSDMANAMALQADGKIVVAGQSFIGSGYDFSMVRYNTNGSLDNSFDGDGKLTTDIATFNDYGCAVAIQVNGRIIVAGYCETLSTNNDFALARYNSDGSVDNSFDGDGKSITNINAFDYGYALKLSGLRIYLGGQSHDDVFTIVAYQNDALPLALQLTAFAAHRQNHSIILNWQTASEQNSSYFSIERSSDGFLFTSIGNKPAAGNSQTSRNYSFTDVTPGKGTNYYRLKQIDLDGKFIYSSIVTVSNKDGSTKTFLAPNPATDHTLLVFSKPTKKMLVTIFTSSGQLVKIIPIADDQNQQLINVTSLPKGEYTIRITNDEATEVLKLVKQ